MMKALQLVDEESDKIAFREIDIPKPEGSKVLIKIKAAALNHRDQWCRQGMYPGLKYDVTLGSDGAGTVEEIGKNVDQSWIGKEVILNPNIDWGSNPEAQSNSYHILGMPTNGTFAEYVLVDVDRLAVKPAHLSFSEAAALPLAGLTAYRALFTKGLVKEGSNVLVTGIGGGVAQMAFLLSKAAGANVYITSGNQDKIDLATKNGAQAGYNYKDESWTKTAKADSNGFDAIIDSGGGDLINQYLKVINPGGRIVCYGSTSGTPKKLDVFRLFWSQASIHGSTMGNDQEFIDMVDFVNEHKVIPAVDSVRPFDQAVSAFDEMKAGSQNGKLVLEF